MPNLKSLLVSESTKGKQSKESHFSNVKNPAVVNGKSQVSDELFSPIVASNFQKGDR